MKTKILSVLIFFSLFFVVGSGFLSYISIAQNTNKNSITYYKIEGKVIKQDKQVFPFVYVFIKEHTKIKTTTELDGTFILTVPDTIKQPFNLIFTSTGYDIKSYKITSKNKTKKVQITLKKSKPKVLKNTSNSTGFTGKSVGALKKSKNKLLHGADGEVGMVFRDAMSASVIEEGGVYASVPGALPDIKSPEIDAAPGLLTAGEINDFSKWEIWSDVTIKELEHHQKEWRMFPDERYVAQLTTPDRLPIVDALVFLKDNQGNTIWQTRTDNTGKAELWAKMLDDGVLNTGKPYKILFSYKNKTVETEAVVFPEKINSAELKVDCSELNQVDVQFVVDATGSMGDEIKYLQAELYDVIEKVQKNNTNIKLRTGSVFYRDEGDDYLTRKSPLDSDINKTIEFIKKQEAGGGGDYPEAVDIALFEAVENENWNENSLARIIFLVLDAPPHQDTASIERVHRQVRLAAMKGIRIVPLVCSGTDKSTEYLMRSIALATNGTYVFLTDESGIGAPHMKPTTDKYEVEKLNHILLRIITEFSQPPNCNNNWADWNKDINSHEKFIPKPYKENPEEGAERLDLEEVFEIYPNPCDGELKINLLKDDLELFLIDITGKALIKNNFEKATSIIINMHDYSVGTYFINVFYKGHWYTHKFLLIK